MGSKQSEELIVNISDREGFSLSNKIYMNPGEIKTVSFTWSTLVDRDQEITANFFPSNLDAAWNRYNSGSKTFTIIMDEQSGLTATNTPGFELIIVAFAVIILIFIYRKKQLF